MYYVYGTNQLTDRSIKQEEDLLRYLYHLHPEHPFLNSTENDILINVLDNAQAFAFGNNEVIEA
jgi:hypothetical protein